MASSGSKLPVSDIIFDTTAFQTDAVLPATTQLNNIVIQKCIEDQKWYIIGAEEYRKRREAGKGVFPSPVKLPHASEISVPSRDAGREIKCRVFRAAQSPPNGVFYHIHGGGWVIGGADNQDLFLDYISKNTQLTIVSVEYRLSPEHPFPAGPNDCYDVADWLVSNSREQFGADLSFVGGESAGGHLTGLTVLHLRKTGGLATVKGVIFNYPCLDVTFLPSLKLLDPEKPLVLSHEGAVQFRKAFMPDFPAEDQRRPDISPLYNHLENLCPALFIVGTVDGLLDDSILGSARWQIAGNEATIKFFPGAAHGFMTWDGNNVPVTKQGWEVMVAYLSAKLGI